MVSAKSKLAAKAVVNMVSSVILESQQVEEEKKRENNQCDTRESKREVYAVGLSGITGYVPFFSV